MIPDVKESCYNSRVFFGPFNEQNDTGIRCHNSFTAFFWNLFGRITVVKMDDGTTIYLNKGSFENWKKNHPLHYQYRGDLSNPLIALKAYCASKYANEAQGVFQQREGDENSENHGLGIFEKAIDLEPWDPMKKAWQVRMDLLKKLDEMVKKSEYPQDLIEAEFSKTIKKLDRAIRQQKQCVEGWRKRFSVLDSSIYFGRFELLKKITDAFSEFIFYEFSAKDMYLNELIDHLKELQPHCQIDLSDLDNPKELHALREKMAPHLDPGFRLEDRQFIYLRKNHYLPKLTMACKAITSQIGSILKNALEEDLERIYLIDCQSYFI